MANETLEVVRAIPPRQFFRGDEVRVQAIMPGQATTPIIDIQFPAEGGVLCFHQGDKYPVKGWPFREASYAVDSIKRAVINSVKFFTSSPTRYLAGLFILFPRAWKRRVIRKALEEFADYTFVIFDRWGRVLPFEDDQGQFSLQGVVWKPELYCDMVREFRRVGMALAGEDSVNQQLVEAICMFLEFDDAYRYFTQDIFEIIDMIEFFKTPGKEIVRVLTEARRRGGEGTGWKFAIFIKLIPFLFLYTDFRALAVSFFKQIDIDKMKLSKEDWYRCLLWGYDFRGVPKAQRVSLRMMIDAEWVYQQKQPS
jgi:hypothetical protein